MIWVVSGFRLKASPGISSSCISPLTSSVQCSRASWASQTQKSATLSPQPGGKPRKFVRTCGGIGGGGGFEDTVGYSTVSVLINHVYAHRHIWQTLLSFSSLLGKVKVECTLIPTLRLCTGRTAHRGSRGIALLFLDHDTRRGMRGQRHAPAALYPWERPGTHCTGGWVGPRASLDRRGKSRPHRDSIPGPSNP